MLLRLLTVLAVVAWVSAPGAAFASCDESGLCCSGQDAYVCTAGGAADLSVAPASTCNAQGCAAIGGGASGCVSSGVPDWSKTHFCTGYCQAGCTGKECPGECQSGTQCVNGVCTSAACGILADWRKSVWAAETAGASGTNTTYTAPPASGIRAMCSGRFWSYGIRKDGGLAQWGYQYDTNNLFGSTAVAQINDAAQVACSRWRLSVLHTDGTLDSYGDSPYGQPVMPSGLTGIKAVAATDTSVGWITADGSIAILPASFGYNQYNGNKAYQQIFAEQKGTGAYKALSGNGVNDVGYAAIKTDGTVVIAAQRLDFGPWNAAAPASVTGAVAAAVGYGYAIALKQDGSVVVWDTSNVIVPNPPGLKKSVAVAVLNQSVPVALQIDGTVAVWPVFSKDPYGAALTAQVGKLTGVTALDPSGMGALFCIGSCGAVSDTGCCNGNERFWCDASGALKSETCAAGTCGWQTQSSHVCDNQCGQKVGNCWCDESCKAQGDCCNAAGTGTAGNSCGGSTCGSCNAGTSPFSVGEFQCNSSGGGAPGGQVPLQACICIPNCQNADGSFKQCGDDGCGSTCDKGSCDDGNVCTTTDLCAGEACVGTPVDCDDGNPCTADACSVSGGQPTCTNIPATLVCSDNNACTVGDTCNAGECTPGQQELACDDGKSCTDDSCSAALGCVFAPNNASCSDGNVCTIGDTCSNGTCTAGSQTTDCNDANPCTDDTCDAKNGCQFAANNATCDDNSTCTNGDNCSQGKCLGVGNINCDDGNACTQDDCLDATTCAAKVTVADGTKCWDGSACHLGGSCSGGQCSNFTDLDCNDGNPCTTDACDPGLGCTSVSNTAPCSDGNACTSSDICSGGACVGGAPLTICDDGNPCTDDCNPASGCGKKANSAPCDDGSTCTLVDQCVSGKCVGSQAKACDDGNLCTLDSCNAVLGCQHAFGTATCDDQNACTQWDVCWKGSCTAGSVQACTDGNPCTKDACDAVNGCVFLPTKAPCDDKNACTSGDVCSSGQCVPGKATSCDDGNGCTTDSCNPTFGCVFVANSTACDDGIACTLGDICAAGVCSGKAKSCDDGNYCTDDSCDAKGTCGYAYNQTPCDDGNPCTTADACDLGQCRGGKSVCDDNNPCTTDACKTVLTTAAGQSQLGTKCSHEPQYGAACDDGDACTTADSCDVSGQCSGAGLCLGGTCQASGGKAVCTCPAGSKAVAKGAYTQCCVPNCAGKVCGDDGCGGTCGTPCQETEKCSSDGKACEPKIACYGKALTDQSCCDGRKVRRCTGATSLAEQNCAATGQYCGWSAAKKDYACTNDGLTEPSGKVPFACPVVDAKCVPDCSGRVCGPDGCGGTCGKCSTDQSCDTQKGQCVATVCGGAVPLTGCVENLVWQKFSSDLLSDSYFKFYTPKPEGSARYFLGCGCETGKYDTDGACLVEPVKSYSFPKVSTDCKIRTCKKNSDGSSTVDNVSVVSCPAGLTWNNDTKRFECPNPSAPNGAYKPGVISGTTELHGVLLIAQPFKSSPNGTSGLTYQAKVTSQDPSWGGMPKIACSDYKTATCTFPTKRVCGNDDFGNSCGSCASGQVCNSNGSACVTTTCGTKQCGFDAAGNSCGVCKLGQGCTDDGQCVTCAVTNAEVCSPTGDVSYCTASGDQNLKCGAVADPVTGAKYELKDSITGAPLMAACGQVSGNQTARTCFTPATAACDAACKPTTQTEIATGSAKSMCSCDADCQAKGTCCKGWATCAAAKAQAKCGNQTCEPLSGENGATCPADCKSEQLCTNKSLPAAPWSWQITHPGTLASAASANVPPTADVRPRLPAIPNQALLAHVPELGTVVGSPRATVVEQRTTETLLDADKKETKIEGASTVVGATAGIDGAGMLIDGAMDATTGKYRRAALTVKGDGKLRRGPSQMMASAGGFTVAAWVKLPQSSVVLPNVLGSSEDLGAGTWETAAGRKEDISGNKLIRVQQGERPGHREACFTSRPGDPRIAIGCGSDAIADVDAYWGDAAEAFLPNNSKYDICFDWRRVPRTGVCQDRGIGQRLREACVGKQDCTPSAEVIGADPCQGVTGSRPRLMVRAICRPAPAGMTLFVEGQTGPVACTGGGCPSAPDRRLALHVPVAVPNSYHHYIFDKTLTTSVWRGLTLRSGAAVPTDTWFHVAVVFQPDATGADEDKHQPAAGSFVLYVNGVESARDYGRAPPAIGWHWGRGYLSGMQGSWPNVWGSQYGPSDKYGNDTPMNAVAKASFDELFTFGRALRADEVRRLVDKPTANALRVWPAVSAREVAAENLWTTGGTVQTVPIELGWLRDPGACSADATATGLVQAPFQGLRVSSGATLAMPADGADLAGLSQWALTAWLRAPTLTAGKTLLQVQQGAISRFKLESTADCGGRGLRAVFADGTALALPNCDHVLAPGEWHHVLVAQFDKQRALILDGAAPSLTTGSGKLFDAATAGASRVVATAAADIGYVGLFRGQWASGMSGGAVGQARQLASASRSTGPVAWLGMTSIGGVSKWVDYSNFHNNTESGAVDTPVFLDNTGQPTSAVSWSSARVPLRGRLAADAPGTVPPLTIALTLGLPKDANGNLSTTVAQAGDATADWAVAAHCVPGYDVKAPKNYACNLWVRLRKGTAAPSYWSSSDVYRGAPGTSVALAFSIDGEAIVASSLLDGAEGAAVIGQKDANAAAAIAFAPMLSGNKSQLHFYRPAAATIADLRVWYGAGAEDNLAAAQATTCAAGSVAATCTAQHRTCADVSVAGGTASFGLCGGCAPGYGEAAGTCLQQRPAMAACSVDAECADGICASGLCYWASGDAGSEAAKVCSQKGHSVYVDPISASVGKNAYACDPSVCLVDFTLSKSQFESDPRPGFERMPVCQWSPTIDAGNVCSRDTQCKDSGVCTQQQESVYDVKADVGAKLNLTNAPWQTTKVGTGSLGPDWTCQTKADTACGVGEPKTSLVGQCLMPNAAACKADNRQAGAASGTDYAGKQHSGAYCSGCLTDTLKDGTGATKPVYISRRDWLEPKACAAIVNNYAQKSDWLPVLSWNNWQYQDQIPEWSACLESTNGLYKFAQVATKAGISQVALVKAGEATSSHFAVDADPPNVAKLNNPWLGFFGHQVGGTIYIQRTQLFGSIDAGQWLQSKNINLDLCQQDLVRYDGFFASKLSVPTLRAVRLDSDILGVTPNLQVLGYLLGIHGLPAKTTELNTAQMKQLRDAGVGGQMFALLAANEGKAESDKTQFDLAECFRANYKQYKESYNPNWLPPSSVESVATTSRYYDRELNRARCVYDKQVNGTQCPFQTTDTNIQANSLCESSYCAYDSGKCETAVTEVEAVKGSETSKSSGNLSDDIGPFRFTHSSEAALRFGKYPKQTIFQALKLPIGVASDIAEPAAGALKDWRHLQVRAALKADLFVPIPKSFGTIDGSQELTWSLVDFDLGYTIAPGHKIARKKVRFAPKIAIFGATLVGDLLKPVEGDLCGTTTPPACGYTTDNSEAALTCFGGKWTYSSPWPKCGSDKFCAQTGPNAFACNQKLSVSVTCSNQVKDGEYVPPTSGASTCKVEKSQTTTQSAPIGGVLSALVPTASGIDLLDIKFPTLGGECTEAKHLEAAAVTGGYKPFWTQGLGKQPGLVSDAAADGATDCMKKDKEEVEACMKTLVEKFSGAPGKPPTKMCFRIMPLWIGPLPLLFQMEAAPVLRFKAGLKVDDTTFEPAVFIRPSLGLELDAIAKFDLKEVVGAEAIMSIVKSKAPAVSKLLKWASDKISAQVGLQGELAIVEVAFPVTWSIAMVQAMRTADRTVKYVYGDGTVGTIAKSAMVPNVWLLQRKFTVDLELTLLRLTLKFFYKFGVAFLPLNPQIEKEMDLFNFSGFIFNWKLADQVLEQWKTDFDWPGPKF